MKIIPRQGKHGRWFWQLVEADGKHICMSAITGGGGFGSKAETIREAKRVFGGAVEIEGEYGPEYAGQRDFSD